VARALFHVKPGGQAPAKEPNSLGVAEFFFLDEKGLDKQTSFKYNRLSHGILRWAKCPVRFLSHRAGHFF
jgi:hypothetical protein